MKWSPIMLYSDILRCLLNLASAAASGRKYPQHIVEMLLFFSHFFLNFLDSFSSASVTFLLTRWVTDFGALSFFVIGQWPLLRKRQILLDAFQTDIWFSFHCLFLVFQLIETKWTMCPSVCSSARQSVGWECFQSWEVVQGLNINRSVVDFNPGCHHWAVEILPPACPPARTGQSPRHSATCLCT